MSAKVGTPTALASAGTPTAVEMPETAWAPKTREFLRKFAKKLFITAKIVIQRRMEIALYSIDFSHSDPLANGLSEVQSCY